MSLKGKSSGKEWEEEVGEITQPVHVSNRIEP